VAFKKGVGRTRQTILNKEAKQRKKKGRKKQT
jgi:hypothetical protein